LIEAAASDSGASVARVRRFGDDIVMVLSVASKGRVVHGTTPWPSAA
jgi:hypothetical protein